MTFDDISDRRYGPARFEASRFVVARFVEATGDDPERWSQHGPPGIAAAALFTVAPQFLADPVVAPHTTSVVHTEQVFRWSRPLAVGEDLEVLGSVGGVRQRSGLNVVTFDLIAGGTEPWLEATSTFLLSADAAGRADEEPEPAHDDRGPIDPPVALPFPDSGAEIQPMRRSASRADLVRYAAATGDWNPIHWDHGAATAAGLPGVIVHGLLMAAWMAQAAGRHTAGPSPLASMRLRFRRALRPAEAAVVTGRVGETSDGAADLTLELGAGGRRLVTGGARVTL